MQDHIYVNTCRNCSNQSAKLRYTIYYWTFLTVKTQIFTPAEDTLHGVFYFTWWDNYQTP